MYAKDEQVIKDFYGKILGRIYTFDNGDKQARDFYGKCLGNYIKSRDVTLDFYGRVVAKGDALSGLIFSAKK